VGFHIGSIPRGYHVGEGYYNHFGDWYWDIKAPNANKVYVASDNNGVFFHSTDGCENWNYFCFGQDSVAPPAGYGAVNVPQVLNDQFAGDDKDTALSILSIHVDNSGKLSLGSSTLGKLFYQDGSQWRVTYPVLANSRAINEGDLVAPYGIWINAVDKRMVLGEPVWQSAGSYGFMSNNINLLGVDWFSHQYVFNDFAWNFSFAADTSDTIFSHWALVAGTHGALLWHIAGYAPSPDSFVPFSGGYSLILHIEDEELDNGGSVQLQVTQYDRAIESFQWVTAMKPDTANYFMDNTDPNHPALRRILRVLGTTQTPYWPGKSSYLEKQTLPGYVQPFRVTGFDAQGDSGSVGRGNNSAGDDDLKPQSSLIRNLGGRYIYDWPGLSEDSSVTELWWEEPEFSEDSSLAGYFVCPVEVTAHYDYETDTLTYYYWIPGTAYKPGTVPLEVSYRYIPFEDLPKLYDSLKCAIAWPAPDEPSDYHIVHTAPIRRNLWHGVGPRPDSSGSGQGQYYAVLPVDYSGNIDLEHGGVWLWAPYPGPAGISESEGTLNIPFALEVTEPTISSYLTSIKYSLPVDAEVHLNLYDVTGRRVKSIFNGKLKAGYHTADIYFADDKGFPLAQGVYFIRYSSENRKISRKVIVMR
jgi:hypothetical protein